MGLHPLPKYHFRVEWGGTQTAFMEVSGLSIELAVIEHRDGSDPTQSTHKLPGLKKYSNIILKRALQKEDAELFMWMESVTQSNGAFRRDLTITLLNEEHQPVLGWRVRNAWPCKYEVASLNASSNEVLIETIELAHEGIAMNS